MMGNWQPLIDAAASLLGIIKFALIIVGVLAFIKGILGAFERD